MEIKLVSYGIAKDIIKAKTMSISLQDKKTVGDLKDFLMEKYPGFSELRSLRFAISEEYRSDDHELAPGDEVVIIPPVSGG